MIYQINKGSKYFGGNTVFEDIQFEIKNTEKIAVVGRNGCGKSTLLKCINGIESLDKGNIHKQNGLTIGYLSQSSIEDENQTVLDELNKAFEEIFILKDELEKLEEIMKYDFSEKILNKYAELQNKFEEKRGYDYMSEMMNVFTKFGFDESDLKREIKTFSGGQKTRIAFVKLLLIKPDILLLDEPTNHLDLESIQALNEGLINFKENVMFTSHDHQFVQTIANRIIGFKNGNLINHLGTYDEYLDKYE